MRCVVVWCIHTSPFIYFRVAALFFFCSIKNPKPIPFFLLVGKQLSGKERVRAPGEKDDEKDDEWRTGVSRGGRARGEVQSVHEGRGRRDLVFVEFRETSEIGCRF